MICAIHQPQFLPWLGYFAKILQSDCFVLLDDVQFKKNEWQNRNLIKSAQGRQWLTIPVRYNYPEKINEVRINTAQNWKRKHIQALQSNYGKSPFFSEYFSVVEQIYNMETDHFSEFVIHQLRVLLDILEIDTPVYRSSSMDSLSGHPTQRLIDICMTVNAGTYLSGPGGRDYLDLSLFSQSNIHLEFQEYRHPGYRQRFGEFISHLSVIDLLFNEGPDSKSIIERGYQ